MKIAVGMSGGVDSSVAAAFLLEQGYEVIGLTMQIWDDSFELPGNENSACYGPDEPLELEATRKIAERLGIKHHTIPLAAEYREHVINYFQREYMNGRTPNPCVRCNHSMKFGFLLSAARKAGIKFDAFATGHYARVFRDPATSRNILKRARDLVKDQSYFLSRLTQEQLANVYFPLGEMNKERVRAKARDMGFHQLANQPESQDFVACGNYTALFKDMNVTPGPIMDRHGKLMGRHKGIVNYTIGQRKGLELGGNIEPYYVINIDAKRNMIIVGLHNELLSPGLLAADINWIATDKLTGEISATAKIRRQTKEIPAILSPFEDAGSSVVKVIFSEPQIAITPGQAVVFYQNDIVLGGGWIERGLEQEEMSQQNTV